MLYIQKIACAWNDGTIIACSPIVTGSMMEPTRMVLRDLGNTFVVQMQVWPLSELPTRVVTPFYVSGNYFNKNELGALNRAWDCFNDRYRNLVGCPERIAHLGRSKPRDKDRLSTEIRTLS